MKKVDYVVVGIGLAGIAFCEQLRKHNKTFLVFDDSSQLSSIVAAGVYNPVILKRFTASWKASKLMQGLPSFYHEIEKFIDKKINFEIPVLRKFNSIEEQNNWFAASDKNIIEDYLSLDLIENPNPSVNAPLGFGLVNNTGRINTSTLIEEYKNRLGYGKQLLEDKFDYNKMKVSSDSISYEGLNINRVVFSEGFGIKKNPYFNHLPLLGNKGEILIIKSPSLKLNSIIKSSIFLVPMGDNFYYVGATYNREDKALSPTFAAKEELINKLNSLINCDYIIINQLVGIRPTVKDRRPLVGVHPDHQNLAVLNGLGTRGVMIAPYVSEQLYNHLEISSELDPEINIARF